MNTVLNIVIAVAALLLIVVVLMQKSRGSGVATQFDGFEKSLGVKTTAKFFERATIVLAGIIAVTSIISTCLAS